MSLRWPRALPQNFDVVDNDKFSAADAIMGSILSWKAGDFNYSIADPYKTALDANQPLSANDFKGLLNLEISPKTAGFFSIPVCQVFDLRTYPPYMQAQGSEFDYCAACSHALGGTPRSKARFVDNVPDTARAIKYVAGGRSCPTNVYYGPH